MSDAPPVPPLSEERSSKMGPVPPVPLPPPEERVSSPPPVLSSLQPAKINALTRKMSKAWPRAMVEVVIGGRLTIVWMERCVKC